MRELALALVALVLLCLFACVGVLSFVAGVMSGVADAERATRLGEDG